MPKDFFFPTYVGLLSPDHKDKIGPALWEFLWFISKTTKEFIEGEENLGIVLGGKPIKFADIVEDLGSSESTVKKHVNRLKKYKYIESKRTPYGEIYYVRNSKKFKKNRQTKNGLSENERQTKNGLSEARDRPKMDGRQTKNGLSNKDIKDIKERDIKKEKEEEVSILEKIIGLLQISGIVPPRKINRFLREDIEDVIENFGFETPIEIIEEAIKDAARGNGETWKFVYNKLNTWRKSGVKTLADLDHLQENRKVQQKASNVDYDSLAKEFENE
ncbi:DnaD domain protein [Sutcliffiella horikoshii]|uniref:DnaD domain protein n=1 Tax=Sutcliffiella horikoshii TaxID=79883 RepID=UPI00203B64CB|nr:DnaD domain protein [Sutcliffiella horikoshii]MCM3618725.1 DnaD domain protein [Sutcliffiella horikoshii]